MSSPESVFISYRRSDSRSETDRIFEHLAKSFGDDQVFRDLQSIPLGVDFPEHLKQKLSECQVLLVLIGKTWLTVEKNSARRLDDPKDYVRIEVETALRRNIPVIPVLLEGCEMPDRSQLPESLQPLASRNGITVGYDPRFKGDMDLLIKAIKKHLQSVTKNASETIAEETQSDLPTFSFEVVTVDQRGRERSRQQNTAKYIRENLGNGVTLDIVKIPGGQFQMGSPAGEGNDNERPQRLVTVESFAMGQYPVTQAQWKAVADFPKVKLDLDSDPSYFKGYNRPVEQVTWDAAEEFCKRLSQKTGREYRLPSEAEWEYACRAGATTLFHFGETITREFVNCKRNLGLSLIGRLAGGETTEVGRFKVANAFGLADMHGNVWEWCLDHWHDNYRKAPSDGGAWETGGDDSYRVLRGGSWYDDPVLCRSANRDWFEPDGSNYAVGLRVAFS